MPPLRRHRLKAKVLSTHSNIAFLSSLDISRGRAAINHPCVSRFSIIFATFLGLASSNAVSMSKLAQYIVGRITPDMQLLVGRQLLDLVPFQKEMWNRCFGV